MYASVLSIRRIAILRYLYRMGYSPMLTKTLGVILRKISHIAIAGASCFCVATGPGGTLERRVFTGAH
jgi:hypothetical protein